MTESNIVGDIRKYYDCIYRNPEKGPCIQSWSKYPEDHQIRDHLYQMHGLLSSIMSSKWLKHYVKEAEQK